MEILKLEYTKILNLKYLIKYGYFSYKKKGIMVRDSEYFQNEIFYKIFDLSEAAERIPRILPFILEPSKDIENIEDFEYLNNKEDIKTITEPIFFSIPKKEMSRRQYKMPNLYSYAMLAQYVEKNKNTFIDSFCSNRYSTSKYLDIPIYSYSRTEDIKDRLLQVGNHILHLDISNFYHTLYTHSIPWMLEGKEEAKVYRDLKVFGNGLDKLLQNCQYGETYGIPTGNLISRIIAELYMCKFDEIMEEEGFVYSRYVDDFSFPYSLTSEKDRFIENILRMCRRYNLNINTEKTRIEEFPEMNIHDKSILFSFFDSVDFSNIIINEHRKLLKQYISKCITEEAQGNKGAIKVLFTGIERAYFLYDKKIGSEKLNEIFLYSDPITGDCILEKLLDISIKKPENTNRFIDIVTHLCNFEADLKKIKGIVESYFKSNKVKIRGLFEYYRCNKLDLELYQILLYTVLFKLSGSIITKSELSKLFDSDINDFSLVLLTIIYLQRKYSRMELLGKIETVLKEASESYEKKNDRSRFVQKMWFFRYFIYYIIDVGKISQVDLHNYYKENGIKCKDKKASVFQSELDKNYILTIGGKEAKINLFYRKLLEERVSFVKFKEVDRFT